MVLAYLVLPTLLRSVPGCDLGNRATKLGLRNVDFRCSFFFRLADPPRLGAGDDLEIPDTPIGGITSPRPPH